MHIHSRHPYARLALLCIAAIAMQSAQAATYASVNWAMFRAGTSINGGSNTDTAHASYTDSRTVSGTVYDTASWAYASLGYAQGYSTATLDSVTAQKDHLENNYVVGWTDTLTISDPLFNGSAGVLNASIRLDMDFEVTGPNLANPYDTAQYVVDTGWHLSVAGNGSSALEIPGERTLWDTSDGIFDWGNPSVPAGIYDVSIPFVFGTAFDIDVSVAGGVQMHTNPTYQVTPTPVHLSAFSDFSHTAQWQGIASVLDENGTAVTGYNLASASGTDWSRQIQPSAVPVPAAAWLFGSGLLGLIGIARRKG